MCVSGGKKCQFFGNFAYLLNKWNKLVNKRNKKVKQIFQNTEEYLVPRQTFIYNGKEDIE